MRTRDGHHVRPPAEHPGQRQLRHGAALALGDGPHAVHQLHVLAGWVGEGRGWRRQCG